MTKEEMGDILEPFYQYVGRQSDDEEWVKLRDLVYELVGKLERPKGKWIDKGGLTRLEFECCNCGHKEPLITPFCSWCGMDMRGEE